MTWSHLHEHWEELVKLFEVRVLGQSQQGFDTGEEKKKGGHVAEHLAACCPEKNKTMDELYHDSQSHILASEIMLLFRDILLDSLFLGEFLTTLF